MKGTTEMHATKNYRAALLGALPFLAIASLAASGQMFAKDEDVKGAQEYIDANTARMDTILAKCEDIQATADAEKRLLNKEEEDEIKEYELEFDRLERDSKRRQGLMARTETLLKPNGRRTTAEGGDEDTDFRPNGSAARADVSRLEASRTRGFRSSGEFFTAVFKAAARSDVDARLKNAAASTVSLEGVGADGGFAVPPEYREAILSRVFGEDSLLGRTDPIPLGGNQISIPSDMTTPWDASGGIQAYWAGEAAAYSQSKIKLENVTTKLEKLTALVPVSDELLEDNAALGGYIERKAPEKIDFKVSYALVWGNGVGMPLGFMNAPCLVTQAAEGAQTTDTINATNIAKMFSRMPANLRANGVWLIHPDAEPQLLLMTIGQQPIYIPPGGFADSPYGRLLGRPVIPHEVCETVGDLGDLMFVDMSSYLSVKKAAGLKAQTSIHLWFDQDLTAFKFTLRIGGQPWWSAAITPRDGSNTRSPFVTLASR